MTKTKETGTIEIVTEKYLVQYKDNEFLVTDRASLRCLYFTETDFYMLSKYIKAISTIVKEIKL